MFGVGNKNGNVKDSLTFPFLTFPNISIFNVKSGKNRAKNTVKFCVPLVSFVFELKTRTYHQVLAYVLPSTQWSPDDWYQYVHWYQLKLENRRGTQGDSCLFIALVYCFVRVLLYLKVYVQHTTPRILNNNEIDGCPLTFT